MSSPACTPPSAALPVPLPLRVSVEEESRFSTLEKRKKEKIQEYYLSSSSSPSTASPSSPSSPFERCGTETDPSSPDIPYSNVASSNDGATNMPVVGNTLLRKRSSFFGWECAWDQEALERADNAGKLRSAVGSGGASPVRWKSDSNPSSSTKKIQPPLIVDQESFTDLDEDVDADEDPDLNLQRTPTMKSRTTIRRSYSHSPQSHTAVSSPPPVCSTDTEQHHQQDGRHNSVFSTAAKNPHPFIDWFRSLETSASKGDVDVEQEIIRRSGRMNDNERLSSLPLLQPLPPLLLPSMTPPSQSQSLPPTPTKPQSTLLDKPSISSFKKRSVSPALPPLTMPKPSMRLSAMKMGTVRNAFAGVGAKVSARMSINSASTRSSAGATASNTVVGMGMDDTDGDFMDLRDPFASPPPSTLVSAWRRSPIPSTLPLPGTAPETSNRGGASLEIANRKKAHSYHGERRKHKKEKRACKVAVTAGVLVETNSSLHGYSAPCSAGEEDVDFGVEEALLSQRLLRRLDSVSFEWD